MDCTMDQTIYISPCTMGCTMVCLPMQHELYNTSEKTDFSCTMGCTMVYFPMTHGLYNTICIPWPMDCTMQLKRLTSHATWVVQHIWKYSPPCIMGCTMVYLCHGPWIVQGYNYPIGHGLYSRPNNTSIPMLHGLYNILKNIDFPCYMGCATVCLPHGRWIVQQYNCPMAYGLHNGLDSACTPWPMDCTIVCLSHSSWVVQYIQKIDFPCIMGRTTVYLLMQHGLHSSIHTPWPMNCTICIYPMLHGLYNTSNNIILPCTMSCTTVYLPHRTWIVQWVR